MVAQALSVPRSLDALFDVGVVGDLPDGQLLERFTTGHREAAELAFDVAGRAARADGVAGLPPAARRPERRRGCVPGHVPGAGPPGRDDPRAGLGRRLAARGGRRVASRARVESARRRGSSGTGHPSGRPRRNDDPGALDLEHADRRGMARLPEKYRGPIVLCYLEGLTHEGAADRLGWPVGTVRGRLSPGPRPASVAADPARRHGARGPRRRRVVERDGEGCRAGRAGRCAPSGAAAEIATGQTIAAVASARVAAWVEGASRGLADRRGCRPRAF